MTFMARVVVTRLGLSLALVFVLASATFVLTHLAPGDELSELRPGGLSAATAARLRAADGLDRPLLEQYGAWLGRVVRLDFGTSLKYRRPVIELVAERAANTAVLGGAALTLATLIGIPAGIFSGRRRTVSSRAVEGLSVVGVSIPPLLSSILLAWMAARTGWFPVGGMGHLDPQGWSAWERLLDRAWHLLLPACALGLPLAAMLERLQASAMAEAVGAPFVVAAQGRGLPAARVVWHAVRPALRPVLGVYGLVIGSLLGGSFAVEMVMAWPGLGRLTYDALMGRDVHLMAGCAAAGALFLGLGTMVSDLLLVVADPRLRGDA